MPTQTYTPAASWNNTSQYQQNGDVTDATIAQLTGQDALDNIAYLTGSNTRTQVSQLQTVADLAALKAVAAADRRDQDYCLLDTANGERLYKFDSSSAGTGDDYAIVTPNAGTGRWHLVNAKPKTTTLRKQVQATAMPFTQTATGTTRDMANGRIVNSGGGTTTLYCEFEGLNLGDAISGIEFAGNANVAGGGYNIVATFYRIAQASGATTPTITALGTLTITAGTGNSAQTSAAAPLPITIVAGDVVCCEIVGTSGAPTSGYVYWAAVNGTRSYITE